MVFLLQLWLPWTIGYPIQLVTVTNFHKNKTKRNETKQHETKRDETRRKTNNNKILIFI